MKILLLEDDMNRVEQFQYRIKELNERNKTDFTLVHVETAAECIEQIESDKFELILLDHDLGGKVYVDESDTNTGSEVARWINKNTEKINNAFIITHSFNFPGAKNIISLIPGCIHVPSIWTKDKFHQIIK